MVPSPAITAVIGDVLWCLGLGLLLGMLRDMLGLVFGNGRFLCFVWDVLTFSAAAFLVCGFAAGVSATGTVRWYMLGSLGSGAISWYWALSSTLHQLARALLHAIAWPFGIVSHRVVQPMLQKAKNIMASKIALHQKIKKKHEKKAKNKKKQLQNPTRVLYN